MHTCKTFRGFKSFLEDSEDPDHRLSDPMGISL